MLLVEHDPRFYMPTDPHLAHSLTDPKEPMYAYLRWTASTLAMLYAAFRPCPRAAPATDLPQLCLLPAAAVGDTISLIYQFFLLSMPYVPAYSGLHL